MKQKRKVKSLLPYKIDKDGTMLTILLLILSLVLCLGSASLMTVSVGATDDTGKYSMVYPGRDDRVEVLYGLQISDKNKLWDEFVNQFFMKDKTLYLSPNQVKVKSNDTSFVDNTVDAGKYINVLGGENNNVNSDNITLIAGNTNTVEVGNNNVSILGGQSNGITGTSLGAPAVIAGGDENKIINNNSNVIIGGYKNTIENAENAVILGGEKNTVDGGKNIIVGGSNVEVNGVDNVFVYSNSSSKFEPESSNAFYLNLSGGVGINVDAAKRGLSVSGAVGFGEIDINSKSCNENNIGVIGSWHGCLVGCTNESRDSGGWELLDRGVECEKKCGANSYCYYRQLSEEEKEDRHYTGFCTDHVSIQNATRCTNGENNYYRDVVFQTVLIGASEECPVSGDNKCVYRCNPGSELDVTSTSCHKKCKLPWNPDEEVRHGYSTGAYNTADAFCADDDDNKSIDTCAKHRHNIVCDNGDWILADKNGKPQNPRKPATGYVYEFCMLGGYRCKTGTNNYNLTVDYIKNTLNDTSSNRVVKDRTKVNGRRGQYKICIDYNANGETPPLEALNGDSCDTGTVTPQPYHYKFIGCQTGNGYFPFTGNDGVVRCMKDCVLTGENGKLTSYRHNTSITGYKAKDVTCTGSCQSANIVCNDGTWKLGSANGSDATEYKYSSCTLHDKVCSSGYNIDQTIYNQYSGTSIYGLCDAYKANGNACIKQDSKFELIGCKPNNHTEPGHESWMKWCISNTKEVNCSTGGKDPSKYDFIITGVKITWSGLWNEGHWTDPKACEWKCREGHHLSGDYNNGGECVSNKMMVPCKTGWADGHVKYNVVNVEISWVGTWNEGHWTEPGNCALLTGECEVGRCGSACGSKTEGVWCTSPNPNMPTTGAHEINTGEIYTVSCGEKRYCDWMCDPSKHLENGKCVPNAKQCEEVGELVEGAYFDHTNKFTIWQGGWDTGYWVTEPCDILCTGGYFPQPVSGTCVKLPECFGNLSDSKFDFTVVVSSGADDMEESVDRTIYSDLEAASGHLCSLVCDENHVLVEGTCKKCFKDSDSFDPDKLVCVNDVKCPENYASLCEKNASGEYECSCEFLGKCLSAGNVEISVPGAGVILLDNSYQYNRPYWKSLSESQQNYEGKQWKCLNNVDKLEPHSCTYTCKKGYRCYIYASSYSRLRCQEENLTCDSRNFYGYVDYNTKPVEGKTSWDMYNTPGVDYGSFDSGPLLYGNLSDKGCAWACRSSTKLAQRVTKYSYEHRNDSNFLEWHCWAKCPVDKYYGDDGCVSCKRPQYVPDTGLLLGPDENGYGIEGTGNAVDCKRLCPKYWNYDVNSSKCVKVECKASEGKYMYDGEYVDNVYGEGSYGCNDCEINDGYFLTGRNDEAGAYTECEFKCLEGAQYWDKVHQKCIYYTCGDNEYFDPDGSYSVGYGNTYCKPCGNQRVVTTWSDFYANYLGCRKKCSDDELYDTKQGKCIPISVGIECDEGEMPEVDGNGNARCISCLEGGKTWDSDQGKCV